MITYRQAEYARKMLTRGEPMLRVSLVFPGHTDEEIIEAINKIRQKKRKNQEKYRHHRVQYRKNYVGMAWNDERRPRIPAAVLQARETRRLLEPQSLTALLMHDPLPGESALERHSAPSIVHDPLDGLIYRRVCVL